MTKQFGLLLSLACVFLSCEEILEVQDISEQEVQLLSPTSGSVVTDTIVNFNWDPVNAANAYHIQIATPNFQNAAQFVLDSTLVVDSTFVGTRISRTLSSAAYEWRVRALNSDFETAFFVNDFTVDTSSD
ncbi:MAG: hypothetical protein AAF717_08370 [Bacteroidota bacterium]